MIRKLLIRDLTLRDGQQSAFATRMSQKQTDKVLPFYREAGFYAMEIWGGAVPDSIMRYLGEDPWERYEPEMAFADIHDDMDLAEDMVRFCVTDVMEQCADDIELFAKFVDPTLMETLNNIKNNSFARITYTEAIEIMQKSGKKFEYAPEYGIDMQTEHERFLAEEHFKRPVIVRDYPKEIKAFYMRMNDDNKTVAAMDVLVPRIGELIGGSQREERYELLKKRIEELGMHEEDYAWYLDSRKYGSVPHAGFGLGFERMMMLLTGIANIRDVIPFPRTPKSLNF